MLQTWPRLPPAATLRYRLAMLRIIPLISLAIALSACGSDPDKPATAAEGQVAAKAVADVDAAMAEARRAKVIPPPMPAAEAN